MNYFKYVCVILWCCVSWGNASQEYTIQHILPKDNLVHIIIDYLTIGEHIQFIQSNKQTYRYLPILNKRIEEIHTKYQQFLEGSRLPIPPLSLADISTSQNDHSLLRKYGKQLAIPATLLVFFQSYQVFATIKYPEIFCSELWRDRLWVEKRIRDFYEANPTHFEISETYENGNFLGFNGLPLVYDPHSNHLYLFFQ